MMIINQVYILCINKKIRYDEFRLLTQEEIKGFNVNSTCKYGSDGCILEVDLKYSKDLHDLRDNYS